MPRLIPARFPGRCHDCNERIHEGDLIGFNLDGKAICEDCRTILADENVRSLEAVICPKCHLTKPCMCDEH